MIKYFIVFFFLITPFFSFSFNANDSTAQLLSQSWSVISFTDSSGAVVPGGEKDLLLIGEDRFSLSLNSVNEHISGNWVLQDNQLIVTLNLAQDTVGIDSASYVVIDGEPAVIYYEDGEEVVRITDDELQTDRVVTTYEIMKLTEEQLLLASGKTSYTFSKQVTGVEGYEEKEEAGAMALKSEGIDFNSIWRGLIGILALVAIAFLFSDNRRAISWSLVTKGLAIQFVFAVLVLKVPVVTSMFEVIGGFFIQLISFTQAGTDFLFGSFVTGKIEMALINFVIQVLPTIVFFAALTSLLYYWGVLQKIVFALAWVMKKVMRLSGAESLAAAGNIFLGQTESPLLIKPYLDKMTRSELMCLMSGGMATIAGGVLAAYIGFLGGDDPEQQMFYAKHLLAASVMSAPAAVVAAKILVPETEKFDEELKISKDRIGTNALEAIANGTTDGIRLAVNVAGMLLVFIAFIAMANYVLEDIVGEYTGLNERIAALKIGGYETFSLQFILGLLFAPLAWLMGIAQEDIVLVGQLLGEKTILNEFVAYVSLGDMKESGAFVYEKSIVMSTYILCGFANFASIGIQIGGIGALAPTRKGVLSSLGVKALIGGTLASLFTAVLVGMIL